MRRHIWVPLLWTQRILKLSLEANWNFSKEQDSTEMITDYGAQRDRYVRPRCTGTVRARTQMLFNQLINQYGAELTETVSEIMDNFCQNNMKFMYILSTKSGDFRLMAHNNYYFFITEFFAPCEIKNVIDHIIRTNLLHSSGNIIFYICVMSDRTSLGVLPRTFQHNYFNTAVHLLDISSPNFSFILVVWRSVRPSLVFDYYSLAGNCSCSNELRHQCTPARYSCKMQSDQQMEKPASVFRV